MTVHSTDGTHCYIAGRYDKISTTKVGIIHCPGVAGTEISWNGSDIDPYNVAVDRVTEGGFRLVALDDLIQWGNNTHIGRVGTAYTTAQSSFGFDSNKVHLLGPSGAGPPILNWAKANPTKVQSIGLVVPALDIRGIYTDQLVTQVGLDHATYGPQVAYGGAIPPTTHDPLSNAADYEGMPIKIWYSTTDPVCVPAAAEAFAAASGAELVSLGAIGHGSTGLSADDVRLWFSQNS